MNDADWQAFKLAMASRWSRTPNLALRKLRDYVRDGSDQVRVAQVSEYLGSEEFADLGLSGEEFERLRGFCRRKSAKIHLNERPVSRKGPVRG